MTSPIAGFLVRHRFILALLSGFIFLLSISGLPRLQFNSDIHAFFAPDNAHTKDFQALERNYSLFKNNVLMLLDFHQNNVYSNTNLNKIQKITEQLRALPYVMQTHSINNAIYADSIDNELIVDFLFNDTTQLNEQDLNARIHFAKHNAFLVDRMVSNDGHIAAVIAAIDLPKEHENSAMIDLNKALQSLELSIEQNDDVDAYIFGDIPLRYAMMNVALRSLTHLYPIIMLIGIIIIWYYFRSIPLIFSGFTIIICATVFTLGSAGWMSIAFDQTSILSIILVFIIVMADMIHINSNFMQFMRDGDDKLLAIQKSLEINILPIFLTSITTAVGFLCLNAAVSPPLIALGNLTSIGIISAFFFTIFFLPAAVSIIPSYRLQHQTAIETWMKWIAKTTIKHPRRILFFSLALMAVSIPFITLNQLQDDPFNYFNKAEPIRVASDFSKQRLLAGEQIVISIKPKTDDAINDPSFLNQLESFSIWMESQPETKKVLGFHDLIKTIAQAMGDGTNKDYKIPDNREIIAENWFLFNMSLPDLNFVKEYIGKHKPAARIDIQTIDLKSGELLDFQNRIQYWIDENMPDLETHVSSANLIFSHLSRDVVHSMIIGSLLSIFMISAILFIGLRSFKYGCLSLIPNAIPAFIVYGFWGLFIGEINMAIAITFSISMGIIVDDTVHILSKYNALKKQGLTSEQAIQDTLHSTGPALLVTSMIMVSGLLVLTQSNYGVHSIMGWVTAPIIALALVFDFFLLPAILLIFDRKKHTIQSLTSPTTTG